jgi:tetratricopeptide (TPR) repeat protein
MSISRPKELIQADQLMSEGKYTEALREVENFEKKESLSPQEQLWVLIEKGYIYSSLWDRTNYCVEMGKHALKLAEENDMVLESIHARIIMAQSIYSLQNFSGATRAKRLIKKSERLIKQFEDRTSLEIINIKGSIYRLKSWFSMFTGDPKSALESAEKCLHFRKKAGSKIAIADSYITLARASWYLGQLDKALEDAMQSLDIGKDIKFPNTIISSSNLIGNIYSDKGELNQALKFLNKSLSFKEISEYHRFVCLEGLANVYLRKNELNKSLEYIKMAIKIAKESKYDIVVPRCSYFLGYLYFLKGENDLAIEVLESSILIANRVRYEAITPLVYLTLANLDKGSRERAQEYLTQLEKFHLINRSDLGRLSFQVAKAMILKTSGRTRNRAEAETTFKKLIEEADKIERQFQSGTFSDMKMLSLVNLCDIYLDDLYLSNDLEVLEDINPLIKQMIEFANEKHSVIYLAETKLLQSKLALIQLKTNEAEKLLVEAQRIAEKHEFDLLAMKISTEHDTLLTQLDVWKDYKDKNAPVSERIKLASFDRNIDRLQRKGGLEPIELVEEESTLLLIISEGGTLIFSCPFTDEWERDEELFSSFLSAFTSFSDEFFSEDLDRVKFGQYTVLMESVSPYSVCYLYKGQTYLAKQKLSKFTEMLQNITEIWQLIEQYYRSSQVLELKDSPPLRSLIEEIFINKIPEV